MANVRIEFNTRRPNGLLRSRSQGSEAGRWLLEALQSAVSGKNQCDGLIYSSNDDQTLGNTANSGPAIAALLMATSSGAVGGTIGGTLITVTWATSDILSSTALAAAIRASATHNRKVTATNIAARVTIASLTVGQYLDICNVRFTGVNGTPANIGEFDMSGTDTADGTSLALAINRHPSLSMRFRAVSSAGLVYVFPTTYRTTFSPFECISNPGGFSTVTLTAPNFVAGAATAIIAVASGDIGTEVRLTASGTNVSAITNGSAGFLGNGTGGGILPLLLVP